MARSSTFDAIIRLKDQASQQLSKIEANLANHEKAWKRTGKNIQRTFGNVQDAGQNLTTKLTLPLVGAGAAGFAFAADLEDAMGASEQIFGASSASVQKWADDLPSHYGIAEKEAMKYANTMGAMFKNIGGLSEEEASKQTQKLIELAGDAAAMFDGSPEDAMYAFQAALKGNTTMLDNYGMGVNDATVKAKALEMGLESANGQLSLQDKQAATVALIMEQMADAEGQAAREAEGASGAMKSFKKELIDLATNIGEVLLPIITPLLNKIGDVVKHFGEMDEGTKRTIVIIGMFVAAIGPLLMIIGSIGTSIGGLMILFSNAGAIVGAFSAIASVAFSPLVLGIGLAIAAGILLYKNWDTIKQKASEVTKHMSAAWGNFTEDVKIKFEQLKNSLVSAADAIKTGLSNAFGGAKQAILDTLLGPLNDVLRLMGQVANSSVGKKVLNGIGITIPKIGKNASGTNYWRGGLTTVNERGGELIDLQRGARIYPHDKSIQMAFDDGAKSATGSVNKISVSFDGAVFHVREEADINRIGKTVAERLRFAAMNRGGAII